MENNLIITENKTNNHFRLIGRKKKIEYTFTGSQYFRWNNKRYYLHNIMRTAYPIMCYAHNDMGYIDFILSGYIPLSNWYGIYVSIDEYVEYVTIWEDVKEGE